MIFKIGIRGGLFLFFAIYAFGCGTTPKSHFYLLDSLDYPQKGEQSPPADDGRPYVGIKEIRISEYLNQSKILIRKNNSELHYAELHRWAEPLENGVARVLAANISILLNTGRVSVYPWRSSETPDWVVRITINRLDTSSNSVLNMVAHWRITSSINNADSIARTSRITVDVKNLDYNQIVLAHSSAIAELSREISDAIKSFKPAGDMTGEYVK